MDDVTEYLINANEKLRIELNRELNRNTDLEREVRELKEDLDKMYAINHLLKKRIEVLEKNLIV